jgi:hypothetical protein
MRMVLPAEAEVPAVAADHASVCCPVPQAASLHLPDALGSAPCLPRRAAQSRSTALPERRKHYSARVVPQVPYYEYALDMILDNEPPADVMLTDQQHEMLENAAEMLYGLIHARYLVTQRGLNAMLEKFKNCDFGRCPRCVRRAGGGAGGDGGGGGRDTTQALLAQPTPRCRGVCAAVKCSGQASPSTIVL